MSPSAATGHRKGTNDCRVACFPEKRGEGKGSVWRESQGKTKGEKLGRYHVLSYDRRGGGGERRGRRGFVKKTIRKKGAF